MSTSSGASRKAKPNYTHSLKEIFLGNPHDEPGNLALVDTLGDFRNFNLMTLSCDLAN